MVRSMFTNVTLMVSGKKQLTFHKANPVRFLTVANNGTICYGYDGEIYTLKRWATT